jgi:hypothetical protein
MSNLFPDGALSTHIPHPPDGFALFSRVLRINHVECKSEDVFSSA